MELVESIEHINNQLLRDYGREFNQQPKFRVVFSDDQLEKRMTWHTKEGLQLSEPAVNELPKYRQYIQGKYILERLVPVGPASDLVSNISYEPAWVFRTKDDQYLPPRFDMCTFIIDSIMNAVKDAGGHAKYKDPSLTPEGRNAKLNDIKYKLFGDETAVGDALTHGYGVTVPGMPEIKPATKVANEATE